MVLLHDVDYFICGNECFKNEHGKTFSTSQLSVRMSVSYLNKRYNNYEVIPNN